MKFDRFSGSLTHTYKPITHSVFESVAWSTFFLSLGQQRKRYFFQIRHRRVAANHQCITVFSECKIVPNKLVEK